jgi:hypothetical protein
MSFRHNVRGTSDADRFVKLASQIGEKRLPYRQLADEGKLARVKWETRQNRASKGTKETAPKHGDGS